MKLEHVNVVRNDDETFDVLATVAEKKICFRKCRIRFASSNVWKMEYAPHKEAPVIKQDQINLSMTFEPAGGVIYADKRDQAIALEKTEKEDKEKAEKEEKDAKEKAIKDARDAKRLAKEDNDKAQAQAVRDAKEAEKKTV